MNYEQQEHWYLGFLGFVFFYHIPALINYFQGTGSLWDLANCLWLLWFLYFLPEEKTQENDIT